MAVPVFDARFQKKLRDLIAWRRDVREFRTDPPPEGTFERLVETASLAPSVGLSQPWRFVLVEDRARRAAVRDDFARCNEAALQAQAEARAGLYARLKLAGFDQAPIQFAVFADRSTEQGHLLGRRTMPEMAEYSTVAAIHTLWLAARAEGLGLGWVSILDPDLVTRVLDIPPDWRFIGYFCLGYPAREDDIPALERAAWEHRRDATGFIVRR
ncbi:MAG: 5,6-dimethylbenzimidazole synthase [Aliidongia sp.]